MVIVNWKGKTVGDTSRGCVVNASILCIVKGINNTTQPIYAKEVPQNECLINNSFNAQNVVPANQLSASSKCEQPDTSEQEVLLLLQKHVSGDAQ